MQQQPVSCPSSGFLLLSLFFAAAGDGTSKMERATPWAIRWSLGWVQEIDGPEGLPVEGPPWNKCPRPQKRRQRTPRNHGVQDLAALVPSAGQPRPTLPGRYSYGAHQMHSSAAAAL
ncbi:hypothetical protein J3F83DRAFT_41342 [Trichoderma novae-zelandiae]